jgi:hypothetical protein
MCLISNLGHDWCISAPVQGVRPHGAWGEFRKGKLFVSLSGLSIRNFSFCRKPGLRAGACGSGAWLIRGSFTIRRVDTMQVKAEGAVQGYVERRSREGKFFDRWISM